MKGNLLNLIGCKNNNKKSGFTLIELNISMLIQLIILTLAINAFIGIIKNYSVLRNNSQIQDPFDDSILNIERLLTGNMIESIVIKEDTLDKNGEIEIADGVITEDFLKMKKEIVGASGKKVDILQSEKLGIIGEVVR